MKKLCTCLVVRFLKCGLYNDFICFWKPTAFRPVRKLEAQVGQKSLTWIRLIIERNDFSNSFLHVPLIPPTKFRINPNYYLSDAGVFGRFSRWPPWHQYGTVLAFLNLFVALMPPIKFRLNPTYGLGGDVVWRISNGRHGGGHLGYRNWMILAILNLHASQMPPTKFWPNPNYRSRTDVFGRF